MTQSFSPDLSGVWSLDEDRQVKDGNLEYEDEDDPEHGEKEHSVASDEQEMSRFLALLYPDSGKQREWMLKVGKTREILSKLSLLSASRAIARLEQRGKMKWRMKFFTIQKRSIPESARLIFADKKIQVDYALESQNFEGVEMFTHFRRVWASDNKPLQLMIQAHLNGSRKLSVHCIGCPDRHERDVWVSTLTAYMNGYAAMGCTF